MPCAEAVRRDGDEKQPVDAEPGVQASKKGTIVVVDDDKAVLRTTVRMLDMLGYAAVAAGSGEEALRLVASGMRIDLVLADFAMPEMTGGELAETIHITHPALPVILVTGFGNSEALKDFGEARILQKPYAEDELLERIARVLN